IHVILPIDCHSLLLVMGGTSPRPVPGPHYRRASARRPSASGAPLPDTRLEVIDDRARALAVEAADRVLPEGGPDGFGLVGVPGLPVQPPNQRHLCLRRWAGAIYDLLAQAARRYRRLVGSLLALGPPHCRLRGLVPSCTARP